MIDYIKGTICDLSPTCVTLEVYSIGYLVNISLTTYSALENRQEAKLFISEVIREDSHQLFGFMTKQEREMFLLLISVSGVGANTARMMLSSLSVEELAAAVTSENVIALKGVKGIGLKTAQRIIVDLRGKTAHLSGNSDNKLFGEHNQNKQEALSALVMLGFSQQQSLKVLDKIFFDNSSTSIELAIKTALKML